MTVNVVVVIVAVVNTVAVETGVANIVLGVVVVVVDDMVVVVVVDIGMVVVVVDMAVARSV